MLCTKAVKNEVSSVLVADVAGIVASYVERHSMPAGLRLPMQVDLGEEDPVARDWSAAERKVVIDRYPGDPCRGTECMCRPDCLLVTFQPRHKGFPIERRIVYREGCMRLCCNQSNMMSSDDSEFILTDDAICIDAGKQQPRELIIPPPTKLVDLLAAYGQAHAPLHSET
jgi:hypothetical protein